jgi:hypothetical protein
MRNRAALGEKGRPDQLIGSGLARSGSRFPVPCDVAWHADEVIREVIAMPLVHGDLIALLRWPAAFGRAA